MKTITAHGTDTMIGFENLARHEQFIYAQDSFTFMAIKINDSFAVFINGEGKFILAKKFKNCLSIGSGYVAEYGTFDEAEAAAAKNPII